MRPRSIVVLSAGVALFLGGWATLLPGALPHLMRMRAERDALRHETEALHRETALLRDEAQALQGKDPASLLYLEKIVRDELGYLRADEVVFVPRPAVTGGRPP